MGRAQTSRAQLPAQHRAKINVFSLVPGRIGVGDVGRQHFHPASFELEGVCVYAKKGVQHVCLPGIVTIHPDDSRKRAKTNSTMILLIFLFF
jgi:hypothetical protein